MGFLQGVFGSKNTKADNVKPVHKADKAALIEKIRQSDLFEDLPNDSLEDMFDRMERVSFEKDENVITEGSDGDYYYLLVSGTADVSRCLEGESEPKVVAKLTEPTGFGEEALISNAKRNATVSMTSTGVVMRLSKDNFDEYVKQPLLKWFSPANAVKKISDGAKWIDVRSSEEADEGQLPGSLHIKLEDVRERASELDKESLYIFYCENGRQSSTAAFLLSQKGYNVGVLRGGLQSLRRVGLA